MKKALIDGDMLLYMATQSTQEEVIWENDIHFIYTDFNRCRDAYDESLQHLMDEVGLSDYLVFFSSPDNWRKDVMPTYKEHRKQHQKPVGFKRLKEYALEDKCARLVDGLEADDLIGIEATLHMDECLIISHDKDFRTVPGYFRKRSTVTGELGEVEYITEPIARWHHLLQSFMGDRVDGYPGCPSVGPKRAAAKIDTMVSEPGHVQADEEVPVWDMIVEAYKDKGLTQEFALMNAQVARILQAGDYTGGQVSLWYPSNYTSDVPF